MRTIAGLKRLLIPIIVLLPSSWRATWPACKETSGVPP
jgi:hypothetical protein